MRKGRAAEEGIDRSDIDDGTAIARCQHRRA